MKKLHRNERISVLLKILTDAPGNVFTFSTFTEMFGSAKSTISEDIDILKDIVAKFDLGSIETIPGAAGGVRYVPSISDEQAASILRNLSVELSRKERILPGGFLFMLDIIYSPVEMDKIGRIFASHFFPLAIDYVITVETKGIPLAYATARYLNVPLVIVRHYNEAADGASVNINYVSGSSKRIQTMVLSIRALKRKSRLLFIDDFMKGGGTARGIIDLAKEFECEVPGIGILVETEKPEKKLVDDYLSLLVLKNVEEEADAVNVGLSPKIMEKWNIKP